MNTPTLLSFTNSVRDIDIAMRTPQKCIKKYIHYSKGIRSHIPNAGQYALIISN